MWLSPLALVRGPEAPPNSPSPLPAQRDAELAERLSTIGDVLNVKLFGAMGDGVTDDTVAIQAAIDGATAFRTGALVTNPIVYLPQGIYLLSDSLKVPSASTLNMVGAGPFASRFTVTGGFSLPVIDIGAADAGVNNVTLASFGINAAGQRGGAPGIKMRRLDRGRIDEVEVATASGAGLLLSNCTVDITRCQFSGNGTDGILVRSSTAVFISRCLNNANGGYSVRVEYDNSDITGTPPIAGPADVQVTIKNNSFESDVAGVILISGVENVTVEMNQFQASQMPAIDVTGVSRHCSIVNNYWRLSSVDPVTTSGGSATDVATIRFGSATEDNVHGLNTVHAGNFLRVRVQDHGLNYSLDHDRFSIKSFLNVDGGAPGSGWATAQRTNVALHSEDLTNAVWVNVGGAALLQSADAGNPHSSVGQSTRITFPQGTGVTTITQQVSGLSVGIGDRVDFGLFLAFLGWTSAAATHDFNLRILDSADVVLVDRLWRPTVEWERFIVSHIATVPHTSLKIQFRKQYRNSPHVFYSWGASLFIGGLGVPPYLATRAATRTIEPAHVALRIIASKGLSVGYGADITEHLSATVTYDPANLVDGATTTTTMTVTGAVVGDTVTVGLSSITSAGWQISGFVTAADTVTVAITNHTGRAVDLPSGTLRVDVWRH